MEGFFTKEEAKSLNKGRVGFNTCYTCGLFREVSSPKFEPYGSFKKEILIIGSAPEDIDDKRNKLWQGRPGRLLRETLSGLGVDLFEDCLTINAVNCHPPKNRKPNSKEINCCRDVKVSKVLDKYDPNVIILLGISAVESFLGHRWQEALGSIVKWRGWTIPDKDFKAWVCPIFHPSYVERMDSRVVRTIWKRDLEKAVALAEVRLPRFKKVKFHRIESLEPLREIKNGMVAFDYETTGLKPQAKGQRIICGSVAYDANNVFVFVMPRRKKDRLPLVELLENVSVSKVASNMKYEDTWTMIRLIGGTEVIGWEWDTMLAAHVLDNRKGISGLKFQAYVRLGVVEYNSEVASYLKAKVKGGNEINRIYELLDKPNGMASLLTYCGYDSIYELRVALLQMEELDYDWLPF